MTYAHTPFATLYLAIKQSLIRKYKVINLLVINSVYYKQGYIYVNVSFRYKKHIMKLNNHNYKLHIASSLKEEYNDLYTYVYEETMKYLNSIVNTDNSVKIIRTGFTYNDELTLHELCTLIIENNMPINFTIESNNGFTTSYNSYYIDNKIL